MKDRIIDSWRRFKNIQNLIGIELGGWVIPNFSSSANRACLNRSDRRTSCKLPTWITISILNDMISITGQYQYQYQEKPPRADRDQGDVESGGWVPHSAQTLH